VELCLSAYVLNAAADSAMLQLYVRHDFMTPSYSQQDATFFILLIFTDALHVSGGFSAHHQEHITVHTASGIVNQYCCWLLPWKRWN